MTVIFYLHASIAVIAMGWAMLTPHAVHALLFAVVSLISLSVSMYSLSAELAAALEVIIYTGAIMVLFIFVIMLLKPEVLLSEKIRLKRGAHGWPVFLVLILFVEILWVLKKGFPKERSASRSITDIATELFHRYGFYVEVISFVLLAGFITAIFIAKNLMRGKKADEV